MLLALYHSSISYFVFGIGWLVFVPPNGVLGGRTRCSSRGCSSTKSMCRSTYLLVVIYLTFVVVDVVVVLS